MRKVRHRQFQCFHESDERFWLGVGLTRSRRYLMIEAGSNVTGETWLLDTADPAGDFTIVWPRKDGVEYDVEHVVAGGVDQLLIVHNDDAVNFELVSVAASDPQGPRRMLLPHDPAVRLEGVDAFRDFVAVEYRREGLPRVGATTIRRVLRDAGSSYQRTRTWCPTGTARRKRKAGVVRVVDPRTEEKRGPSTGRTG